MHKQAALQLSQSDGHVILAARRPEACQEASDSIAVAGGSAEAMCFDGTDPASVTPLVKAINEAHIRLDGA